MTMTLEQARELLRNELLAAAAAVVPGQEGFVIDDVGPINPGVLFDGSGPATVCSITVETGDPSRTDAGAEQVVAAGRALLDRGWQVEPPALEAGHHRAAARRDGFEIAVHAWDGHWKVTLVGETPEIR